MPPKIIIDIDDENKQMVRMKRKMVMPLSILKPEVVKRKTDEEKEQAEENLGTSGEIPKITPPYSPLKQDSPKLPPHQETQKPHPYYTQTGDDELKYSPIKPSDPPELQELKSIYFDELANKFQAGM